MDIMMDLHTHSNCSDGQYSPAEVVQQAKARGINLLALTDHDTADGILAAEAAAYACGIRFLSGIEFSTAGRARQHLLGYGIDPHNEKLLQACAEFADRRQARAMQIAALLQSQGLDITVEEAAREAKGPLGKPHFARVLMKKNYTRSIAEGFVRYLDTPAMRALPDPKPTMSEAIALIHAAGGVAVLAHPCTLKLDAEAFYSVLDAHCACGLDGLEVYYAKHSTAEISFYADCAVQRGLLQTGGSDYHGEAVKPDVRLGVAVPKAVIENLFSLREKSSFPEK